jgi:hypothetical protein
MRDDPKILNSITRDELFDVLAREGYVPEKRKERSISTKMNQINVLFIVSESQKNILAYAGFKSDDTSFAKVNQWNADKGFSRAYLDDDDDPVIELDLDLDGGITEDRLIDFITTVRILVTKFREHI